MDEQGNTIDGDKVMAVCASELKRQGKLSGNTVVATVMSNLGLHEYCQENGLDLVCTAVGDRHVLERMLADGFAIGGEQSGHTIFRAYATTGDGELTAEVVEELPGGNRLVRFDYEGIFLEVLEHLGKMPLPPYIKEELQDQERYQTVYSKVNGSAAAPTAGLHFTQELLDQVSAMGVKLGYVTLHVGLGTFRPVKEDEIEGHEMHSEYCVIPQETADLINETRKGGGRCICVGTTSCRTLESWAAEDGHMEAKAGWTSIYIYPGYHFKVMDGLVTNFHLPESTLIMLVSAFAGREHVLAAYEEAVREKYRFFSFGDAMFIS